MGSTLSKTEYFGIRDPQQDCEKLRGSLDCAKKEPIWLLSPQKSRKNHATDFCTKKKIALSP
jgi:hypothetical protein